MEVILNSRHILSKLKSDISRHGYAPNHQPYLFLYPDEEACELRYFDFARGGGIIAYRRRDNSWYMPGEPPLSAQSRIAACLEMLSYIFTEERAKKITCEDWSEELRSTLAHRLEPFSLRAARPSRVLLAPLVDLARFDAELRGKEYKGMRYARNRIRTTFHVEISTDPQTINTDAAKELLARWTSHRTGKDKVWARDYLQFIEHRFPGCEIVRAISLDGVLRGLSAGWKIPNSDTYYLYLDIHDYSDEHLGEFVSLDHFLEVKTRGHRWLDFGGSDKSLLAFKMKFHPARMYRTCDFSVVKKSALHQ